MDHIERQEELASRLSVIGEQILSAARDELYFGMRFLDVALSSFVYQMDSSVNPFGTDGNTIFFHPQYLGGMYRENRILVNRGYLHMVYHCIFRHMSKSQVDVRYWNLSCDIAIERLTDANDYRAVRYSRSLIRRETYRKLELEGTVLNAEKIYELIFSWELQEKELAQLEEEFYVDDHKYWDNQSPGQKPDPNLEQKWSDINERMETELETFSKEAVEKTGDLLKQVKAENREKYSYRDFLRKFSTFHEEITVDEDSFDYTFYSYGLRVYGNMPLIEPQETKEVRKIAEFVIAIDTSMSCSKVLVQRFLEETYAVLSEEDSFFHKTNIHILQSDEKVHSDKKITGMKELEEYMKDITLYGEGGTDFRPVFTHVDDLIKKGEFENLRGLIYFTDGYGKYPTKAPAYKAAFVFIDEDNPETDVPSWGIKLILEEKELNMNNTEKLSTVGK